MRRQPFVVRVLPIVLTVLAIAGIAPSPAAERAAGAIVDAGSLVPAATVKRLLLTNATYAGNRIVAVGDYGFILYSDDKGQTWRRAATTAPRTLLTAVYFADREHGWAVGHDGLILASADGGTSWKQQRYAPDEKKPLLGVWFKNPQQGIAVGAYALYLETADGGATWTPRQIIQEDNHLNAITAFGDGKLAIAAEAGMLLISTDDGKTWTKSPSPYAGSFFGMLRLRDDSLLAFGLRGKAFHSTDAGQSWQSIDSAGPTTLLGGGIGPGGLVVLAGPAGTVRVSHDGGLTFSPQAAAGATAFAAALPLDERRVLLFGEAGVSALELPDPHSGVSP
jgi:photosystem II stability/assembly factor-like uncharacterized protein